MMFNDTATLTADESIVHQAREKKISPNLFHSETYALMSVPY